MNVSVENMKVFSQAKRLTRLVVDAVWQLTELDKNA